MFLALGSDPHWPTISSVFLVIFGQKGADILFLLILNVVQVAICFYDNKKRSYLASMFEGTKKDLVSKYVKLGENSESKGFLYQFAHWKGILRSEKGWLFNFF